MEDHRVPRFRLTFGRGWAPFFLALALAAGAAASLPAADVVRVPLVAVDSRGAAVGVISRDGIELFANGRRTESFSIEKRGPDSSLSEHRTVFLIFDTLSTTHLWLSKAKIIAEKLLDSADPGIAYLILSLEPGSGLRYVLGPSEDRAEVVRTVNKRIVARQAGSGLDSGPRAINRDDGLLVGDPRTAPPSFGQTRTERDPNSAPKTRQDEHKKGELFLSSLGTLNTALSGFNDSIKTVYFFSNGIASRTQYQDLSTTDPNLRAEVKTVDNLFLSSLADLADVFKTRGAVAFIINPAGAQIGKDEPGSGENQLQLLADRAGGRYLEGEPETLVRRLTEMENAFYEVVLSAGDFGTDPIDIEIRPKEPGLRLFYSHRVFPLRGFDSLSREEKMRLAMDAAEGGNASKMALRLRTAEVLAKSEDASRLQYRLRLPEDFLDSPLDVFRVWQGKGSQGTFLDQERVRPQGGELSLSVEKRKGYRIRVVVVEPRRAVGLVVN